jgi:hypothetical protein
MCLLVRERGLDLLACPVRCRRLDVGERHHRVALRDGDWEYTPVVWDEVSAE